MLKLMSETVFVSNEFVLKLLNFEILKEICEEK